MKEEKPVEQKNPIPTMQEILQEVLLDTRIGSPAQFLICLHIAIVNIQQVSGGHDYVFSCADIARNCKMDKSGIVQELRELIRRGVITDHTPQHITQHGPIDGLGIIDALILIYSRQ